MTFPAHPGTSAHEAERENQARVRANRRRARALCVLAALPPAVVVGVVVGVFVGAPVAAGVAAALVVVTALSLHRYAVDLALVVVGGREVAERDAPALANQVEGLCATLGVTQPRLWIVDDEVPNSCALGRGGERSVLVLTSGMLERLDLIELEGVVAHELAHVKRHDACVSAVAVATAGVVARLARRDGVVHLAVGRGREYGADQAAVLAVRYPPGLAGALGSIARAPVAPREGSVFSGRRWAATRWVWLDPMVGAAERAPVGEIDATDVRAEALAQW